MLCTRHSVSLETQIFISGAHRLSGSGADSGASRQMGRGGHTKGCSQEVAELEGALTEEEEEVSR